jgi:hypothetical protein
MARWRTFLPKFGRQKTSSDDQILYSNDDIERREGEKAMRWFTESERQYQIIEEIEMHNFSTGRKKNEVETEEQDQSLRGRETLVTRRKSA